MEIALWIIGGVWYTYAVYVWGIATGIHTAKAIFEKLIREKQQKVTLDELYGRGK